MKRRILPLLLSLVLCLGLASPAMMVTEVSLNPLPEQVSTFGHHYFHNGLAPVMHNDYGWRYITTNGELIDYGHMYIFDYSEGYAAFADFVGSELKVGYMDVYGNTVLPARYDIYELGYGEVGAGRVIGGEVLVYDADTRSWSQINLHGQTVARTMDAVEGDTIYSDWFGNTDGVSYATVTVDGEEMNLAFSEGYALTASYIVKGAGASDGTFPSEPPAKSSKLEIFFNDRNIIYQTDVGIYYSYVVTNNTGEKVSGPYALMVYQLEDDTTLEVVQFFLMDLDLEDGESVPGEVHSIYSGLSQQKLCWIKFDDEAERDAFFNDSNIRAEYDQYYALYADISWLEAKLGTELP